ncbi:MAG: hypothetical protein RQ930_04060 [Candidatus Aenigmarchaeota archaeon]|jgi:predicted RNA-binding protein YlqC (UPF0109 family)|nr:hypothetical protein [Candidatus Aenigmarchaeota archaeon]
MTEVSQIEQAIKNLIKLVFGVDVSLTSKQTLKGLEVVIDCAGEYKGKILGRKGRTMKLLRRIIKIMGKYQFDANVLVVLKPDNKS